MEGFENGKALRLRSQNGKYLVAKEGKESVSLSRNKSADCSTWTVELSSNENKIRLKSRHDKYLTASSDKFGSGEIGGKVIQSLPSSDLTVDWILKGDKNSLKLETASKSCLRANGGAPPWRNTVTHKQPLRYPANQAYIWIAEFLDDEVHKPTPKRRRRKRSRWKVISGNVKDAAITGSALVGGGAAAQGIFTASTQGENGEKEGDSDEEGDEAAGDSEYDDEDEEEDGYEDDYE